MGLHGQRPRGTAARLEDSFDWHPSVTKVVASTAQVPTAGNQWGPPVDIGHLFEEAAATALQSAWRGRVVRRDLVYESVSSMLQTAWQPPPDGRRDVDGHVPEQMPQLKRKDFDKRLLVPQMPELSRREVSQAGLQLRSELAPDWEGSSPHFSSPSQRHLGNAMRGEKVATRHQLSRPPPEAWPTADSSSNFDASFGREPFFGDRDLRDPQVPDGFESPRSGDWNPSPMPPDLPSPPRRPPPLDPSIRMVLQGVNGEALDPPYAPPPLQSSRSTASRYAGPPPPSRRKDEAMRSEDEQLFDRVDTNRDGLISRREYDAAVNSGLLNEDHIAAFVPSSSSRAPIRDEVVDGSLNGGRASRMADYGQVDTAPQGRNFSTADERIDLEDKRIREDPQTKEYVANWKEARLQEEKKFEEERELIDDQRRREDQWWEDQRREERVREEEKRRREHKERMELEDARERRQAELLRVKGWYRSKEEERETKRDFREKVAAHVRDAEDAKKHAQEAKKEAEEFKKHAEEAKKQEELLRDERIRELQAIEDSRREAKKREAEVEAQIKVKRIEEENLVAKRRLERSKEDELERQRREEMRREEENQEAKRREERRKEDERHQSRFLEERKREEERLKEEFKEYERKVQAQKQSLEASRQEEEEARRRVEKMKDELQREEEQRLERLRVEEMLLEERRHREEEARQKEQALREQVLLEEEKRLEEIKKEEQRLEELRRKDEARRWEDEERRREDEERLLEEETRLEMIRLEEEKRREEAKNELQNEEKSWQERRKQEDERRRDELRLDEIKREERKVEEKMQYEAWKLEQRSLEETWRREREEEDRKRREEEDDRKREEDLLQTLEARSFQDKEPDEFESSRRVSPPGAQEEYRLRRLEEELVEEEERNRLRSLEIARNEIEAKLREERVIAAEDVAKRRIEDFKEEELKVRRRQEQLAAAQSAEQKRRELHVERIREMEKDVDRREAGLRQREQQLRNMEQDATHRQHALKHLEEKARHREKELEMIEEGYAEKAVDSDLAQRRLAMREAELEVCAKDIAEREMELREREAKIAAFREQSLFERQTLELRARELEGHIDELEILEQDALLQAAFRAWKHVKVAADMEKDKKVKHVVLEKEIQRRPKPADEQEDVDAQSSSASNQESAFYDPVLPPLTLVSDVLEDLPRVQLPRSPLRSNRSESGGDSPEDESGVGSPGPGQRFPDGTAWVIDTSDWPEPEDEPKARVDPDRSRRQFERAKQKMENHLQQQAERERRLQYKLEKERKEREKIWQGPTHIQAREHEWQKSVHAPKQAAPLAASARNPAARFESRHEGARPKATVKGAPVTNLIAPSGIPASPAFGNGNFSPHTPKAAAGKRAVRGKGVARSTTPTRQARPASAKAKSSNTRSVSPGPRLVGGHGSWKEDAGLQRSARNGRKNSFVDELDDELLWAQPPPAIAIASRRSSSSNDEQVPAGNRALSSRCGPRELAEASRYVGSGDAPGSSPWFRDAARGSQGARASDQNRTALRPRQDPSSTTGVSARSIVAEDETNPWWAKDYPNSKPLNQDRMQR